MAGEWDPRRLPKLLEEEGTSERINMLKAQNFHLERSNALMTDTLNSQHDALVSLASALGAMRDLVLSADAVKRADEAEVSLPAETWRQLVLHAQRARERARRSVAPTDAGGLRMASQHQLLSGGGSSGRGCAGLASATTPRLSGRGLAAAASMPAASRPSPSPPAGPLVSPRGASARPRLATRQPGQT